MNSYRLIADDTISVGGTEIILDVPGNFDIYKERNDILFMAKGRAQVNAYVDLAKALELEGVPVRDAVEVGIFRGGGAVFLHELFGLSRLVCIERQSQPLPALEAFRKTHPSLVVYYDTDQADVIKLHEILSREFPNGFDIVVDDASHFYKQTRITFETLFPHMRPGGRYLIEDWGWSHIPSAQHMSHVWSEQPALTNLILELTIAFASAPSVFQRMHHCVGFTWIERGNKPLPKDGSFRLDDYLLIRGKSMPKI